MCLNAVNSIYLILPNVTNGKKNKFMLLLNLDLHNRYFYMQIMFIYTVFEISKD